MLIALVYGVQDAVSWSVALNTMSSRSMRDSIRSLAGRCACLKHHAHAYTIHAELLFRAPNGAHTDAHYGTQVMCALLFLACIAVSLPTAGKVFYSRDQLSDGAILHVSHGIAIILIFS
jgi:hypothetical protein